MTHGLTITRALSELKTLEKRIGSACRESVYTTVVFNGDIATQSGVRYGTVENFKKEAIAAKKKVEDLITRRRNIKSALLTANNSITVDVCGEVITIAEAIDRKAFYTTIIDMFGTIKCNMVSVEVQYQNNRKQLDDKKQSLLTTLVGKDKKVSTEEQTATIAMFDQTNRLTLDDPAKSTEWVDASIDQMESFLAEVDFCLSEANARNTIEID